ncbi:hypothetical protein AMTRI_Chr04g183930 [Amborella trichopoda]
MKEEVVENTWRKSEGGTEDPTLYTGLLGTAFTCLLSHRATGNGEDLQIASDIVDTCTVVVRTTKRRVAFLCGRAGVYVLGAMVANYRDDQYRRELFLNLFCEVVEERALPAGPGEGVLGMPYELLFGWAGFLWSALFINKHLGDGTIPQSLLMPIVEAVISGGRIGATHTTCPLMYQWHGTHYWGAAQDLAGIMHVLLHFPLSLRTSPT